MKYPEPGSPQDFGLGLFFIFLIFIIGIMFIVGYAPAEQLNFTPIP